MITERINTSVRYTIRRPGETGFDDRFLSARLVDSAMGRTLADDLDGVENRDP